jgi:hypothetical protein
LGEAQNSHGHLQLQRPDVKIRDPTTTNSIVETVKSDVPDLIVVAGSLEESPIAQEGATLHGRFRRGQPFGGEPALVWYINGEKGEIRLTSPSGTALQAFSYSEPVTIEVHDFESGKVELVDWSWSPWQDELPLPARCIGALYEAFADRDEYNLLPAFDAALGRHEQLHHLLSSWVDGAGIN